MQPPPQADAHDLCGATGSPFGPFDLQAYEHGDYKNAYARTMDLAGFNGLFPELPSFALPPLETAGRDAASAQTAPPYIPPVILKAIGWIESGWAQADYSVPYGGIGGVLASHDCGYGIMQITSGMQNVSGVPSLDQAMIGGHYAFNIARGARILADKWNMAPEWRPIVGNREANLIENWYYALWGYNGFAFKNHPLNADYQGARPPFSCAPDGDGFGHDRSQYPYQELILGCAGRPPLRSGTALWPAQELHLPDLSDAAFAQPLRLENWSPCSHDLQCAPMDIPTPNTNHTDPALASATRTQVLGAPALAVSPPALTLSTDGAQNPSATLTITNSGSSLLAWRATASAPWLRVSRFQGIALGADLGATAMEMTVSVDAAALPADGGTAAVTFESLYAAGAPAAVQVTVYRAPPPPPSAVWGDVDCLDGVNIGDAQKTARALIGLPLEAGPSCPRIGEQIMVDGTPRLWGDMDCGGAANIGDAQKLARLLIGLAAGQAADCPAAGSAVELARP
ncbi:MAG: hypothetical protein Q7T33_09530 [Dehalococcoidia bacterium]|nr:hypothetical protein [Dehalococcoidia bacterium]